MHTKRLLLGGALLRLGLLVYSLYQDTQPVKFTDIDYHVFNDAAGALWTGGSPYDRSTYRYSPLLAYIALLNFILHPAAAKIIFGIADLVTGLLIDQILTRLESSAKARQLAVGLWVLNPFVAVMSMRGSAESVLGLLVLGTMYLHIIGAHFAAAVIFGLSVHFKIYPIIYALPLWLTLPWIVSVKKGKKSQPLYFWSWNRVAFGVVGGSVFIALLGLFFYL